jgi:hypothetical protein
MDADRLITAIRESWSPLTTDAWHPENPAAHQCAVSALVVQDYLGGTIMKNRVNGHSNYFVCLDDGTEVDPARVQFGPEPMVSALAWPRSREEIMAHNTMPARYAALAAGVSDQLHKSGV